MCKLDMWYNDSHKEADKIDITFYPNESKYRGNIYKGGKCIGDYVSDSSQAIEQNFNHLTFNWE